MRRQLLLMTFAAVMTLFVLSSGVPRVLPKTTAGANLEDLTISAAGANARCSSYLPPARPPCRAVQPARESTVTAQD